MAEYTVNTDSLLSTTSQMELTYYQILTLRQNLRDLKVQFPIFDIEYGEIRHSLDEIEKELDEKLSVIKQMMTVLEIIHKWYIIREVKISAIYQYFSLDENQEEKKAGSENKILGIIHGLLDAAGILFEPADAINGAIYGIEGDKLNAAISLGSCIPLVGDIAKTGKYGKKGIKLAKELGEEGVEKVLKETIEGSVEETAEKITKEASEEITAQLEKNADDVVEEIAGKGGTGALLNKTPKDISNMTRKELEDSIPDNWDFQNHNGRIHIKDENGNFRVRIDPPDKVTNYTHIHIFDENKNPLDIFGNIVSKKDPAGHIPYKN
ncbi:hypothetical protein [Anaerosporobacter faecicola]|uniref:hypothetical protein n=1 Tax=Anaerosporobacter faecicola TaxID=2718714 RepID=UPI001A9C0924|nr:hypothetical protein [Anaerosporobacter faecicola]